MIVRDTKHMMLGVVMTLLFAGILLFMFSNFFAGRMDHKVNAFKASDDLFNSIAKGSTNYFPGLMEANSKFMGHGLDFNLNLKSEALAVKSGELLQSAGARVEQDGSVLILQGDLGQILEQALVDSRALFNNQNQELYKRYGMQGREVVYVWWLTLNALEKGLTKAKDFEAAKFVNRVSKRGVEVGYNFYGIPSKSAADKAGILSFSLIFYVVYTLWWGFSIFFLFEGLGLKMSSGVKKEV